MYYCYTYYYYSSLQFGMIENALHWNIQSVAINGAVPPFLLIDSENVYIATLSSFFYYFLNIIKKYICY